MVILGIDPGTATSGYGVIEKNGKGTEAIKWGLIETNKEDKIENRFLGIYKGLAKVIVDFKPDVMVIEKVFFATNAKTAISIGQAQGVMLYCAARNNLKVVEYAPGTIKKVVSGTGRANKKDIQKAVRTKLGNQVKSEKGKKTHFDNAADALAVALCHIEFI